MTRPWITLSLLLLSSCGPGLQSLTSPAPTSTTGPAIQWVQSATNFSTASAFTSATLPQAPSAGNFVVVLVWSYASAGNIAGVTDNAGNTYIQAVQQNQGGNGFAAIFYSNTIVSTGTFTVTANVSGASPWTDIVVAEVSGISPTSPLDRTASNLSGASIGSGDSGVTAVTTQAKELAVAVFNPMGASNYTAINENSTWTSLYKPLSGSSQEAGNALYKILSTTGTQTSAWTITPNSAAGYVAVIATFKGIP